MQKNDKMDSPPRQNKIHRGHSFLSYKKFNFFVYLSRQHTSKNNTYHKNTFHRHQLWHKPLHGTIHKTGIPRKHITTLQRICQDTTDLSSSLPLISSIYTWQGNEECQIFYLISEKNIIPFKD